MASFSEFSKYSSGVENLTRSSLKGFFNRALLLIKWAFCKQFSPPKYRPFISLEKGKFVFQKSLSETPFKPDRASFCTLKYSSRAEIDRNIRTILMKALNLEIQSPKSASP